MSKPVVQIDYHGKFISYFPSVQAASLETGMNLTTINMILKRLKTDREGRYFRFATATEVQTYKSLEDRLSISNTQDGEISSPSHPPISAEKVDIISSSIERIEGQSTFDQMLKRARSIK